MRPTVHDDEPSVTQRSDLPAIGLWSYMARTGPANLSTRCGSGRIGPRSDLPARVQQTSMRVVVRELSTAILNLSRGGHLTPKGVVHHAVVDHWTDHIRH